REERAQMNRGVQIVDELRCNRWLREHELNGRLRLSRVAFDDGRKAQVRCGRFGVQLLYRSGHERCQPGQRRLAATKLVSKRVLAAGTRGEPLRGVRQHESVRLFDRVDACGELGTLARRADGHAWPAGLAVPPARTTQRAGS